MWTCDDYSKGETGPSTSYPHPRRSSPRSRCLLNRLSWADGETKNLAVE